MSNVEIGLASILAWALDLIPAKDGFWSSAVQPGHPYPEGSRRTEPFSALNAAVATLSRGPFTPGQVCPILSCLWTYFQARRCVIGRALQGPQKGKIEIPQLFHLPSSLPSRTDSGCR